VHTGTGAVREIRVGIMIWEVEEGVLDFPRRCGRRSDHRWGHLGGRFLGDKSIVSSICIQSPCTDLSHLHV
jgi:hypothetical protein